MALAEAERAKLEVREALKAAAQVSKKKHSKLFHWVDCMKSEKIPAFFSMTTKSFC